MNDDAPYIAGEILLCAEALELGEQRRLEIAATLRRIADRIAGNNAPRYRKVE